MAFAGSVSQSRYGTVIVPAESRRGLRRTSAPCLVRHGLLDRVLVDVGAERLQRVRSFWSIGRSVRPKNTAFSSALGQVCGERAVLCAVRLVGEHKHVRARAVCAFIAISLTIPAPSSWRPDLALAGRVEPEELDTSEQWRTANIQAGWAIAPPASLHNALWTPPHSHPSFRTFRTPVRNLLLSAASLLLTGPSSSQGWCRVERNCIQWVVKNLSRTSSRSPQFIRRSRDNLRTASRSRRFAPVTRRSKPWFRSTLTRQHEVSRKSVTTSAGPEASWMAPV